MRMNKNDELRIYLRLDDVRLQIEVIDWRHMIFIMEVVNRRSHNLFVTRLPAGRQVNRPIVNPYLVGRGSPRPWERTVAIQIKKWSLMKYALLQWTARDLKPNRFPGLILPFHQLPDCFVDQPYGWIMPWYIPFQLFNFPGKFFVRFKEFS